MSGTTQPSTPRAKALALLACFGTLDTATSISLRTDDCTWKMLPSSLGFSEQTNASFAKRMSGMTAFLDSFPVTPLDVVESVSTDPATGARKPMVSVHAVAEVMLKPEAKKLLEEDEEGGKILEEGKKNGGLKNEYQFIFTFEGEGQDDRIEKVVEWLDADRTKVLMGVFARSVALVTGGKPGH